MNAPFFLRRLAMTGYWIAGGAAVAIALLMVVMVAPDVIRYIRISRM